MCRNLARSLKLRKLIFSSQYLFSPKLLLVPKTDYKSSECRFFSLNNSSSRAVDLAYSLYKPETQLSSVPILILHGMLGSKQNWKSLGKAIARKSKRNVYTLDARNHGDSPHTDDYGYHLMAEDVKHFMSSQAISEAVIVGHSMGGRTSMYFALTYENLVNKLVIVDVGPSDMPYESTLSHGYMIAMKEALASVQNLSLIQARQSIDQYLSKTIQLSKRELKEFFSKFGKVTDCLIVQDHIKRKSRGYGFVIFSNPQEADKARSAHVSELHCDGRVLRVFPAEERKSEKYKKEAREILFQQNAESDITPTCEEESDSHLALTMCKSNSLQNINEMSNDMLLLIFSYFGIRDRVKLEFVCRKWRRLALELWQCQTSLNLQNVFCIWEGRPLTNRILLSLLKKCAGNLKKLDLSTASHTLDYKAVEIIAQCCPNLEHINLSSVKVTNVSLQQLAIKCPKLKHVILQRCFEVGEKGIWWLLHLCKKLECIDLTGNPRITGQCFHMAGSNLQTCVLNKCSRFRPIGFTKLATRCRNLTTLYLNDCYQLSDRALELLCQSLKNLKIFYVGGIFPDMSSSGLHHIGRLSNLENLSLSQNQHVDDDVVYAISRGCKRIRSLDLSGCNEISDYSLTSLSTCYSLRTLNVSYLDRVTDEGLSSIAKQGLLETFLLKGCPNVGDQGLLTLVLLSPYLQRLDVSGCHHVTNVTVTACLDSVQARSSGKKLFLVVGGTSVELEALELDSSLLEVSRQNYCIYSLRPDKLDYLGEDCFEDDEVLCEEQDAVANEACAEKPLAAGDVNGDWAEIFESPL